MTKVSAKKRSRPGTVVEMPIAAGENDGAPRGAGLVLRKAPRPSGCARFVRREIADAMPAICGMLLTRTMEGDLAALKLLLGMALEAKVPEATQGRRGGMARRILVGLRGWETREAGKRTQG